MVRGFAGVVIGYLVIAAFVFMTFSLMYLVLGTEGSFQPNSYNVSAIWVYASIVLGIVGAMLGGVTAFAVGKSSKAALVLAGLVLVLGLVMAVPTLSAEEPQVSLRQGEVGMMEAMQSAQQPTWFALINPLIGAAGVVLGARWAADSKSTNRRG